MAAVFGGLRASAPLRRCRALLYAHREQAVLVGAAVPALAGFVLLAATTIRSGPPTATTIDPVAAAVREPAALPSAAAAIGRAAAAPLSQAPPVVDPRLVCSFSNADARAALVQGADGGFSLAAGGRSYWFFGDTLFLGQSGKQIEQNALAWSDGLHAGGCPRLTYYARNGIAVPFLAKDGSLSVWPTGAWSAGDHALDVYAAYVYGSGPYAYWIGEVGVARLDTRTMQATVLTRRLWDAKSGFPNQVIGAMPVEVASDGLLRVLLQTKDGQQLLARVAPSALADASAYEFWDGGGWSRSPARATPLWYRRQPSNDLERLAWFENGASIAYNPYLRKYIAVENVGSDKIGARVADRLEGPWSAPAVWIDCSTIAAPAVPTCYSPYQHPQFASPDGRTLFLTFTRMANYDVVAYQVTLGPPASGGQPAHGTAAQIPVPAGGEKKP